MSDLIDRQAAISSLNDELTITGKNNAKVVEDYMRRVVRRLEQIPSAEPEIIRCKDCKLFGDPMCLMCFDGHDWAEPNGHCHKAERRRMDDLVSRQKVLRCIKESRENIDWGQSEDGDAFLHYSAALYREIASKECLPTAESEVIRCKECIYYDPEHIENKGIRYEYKDMPKEAFGKLETGLVHIEYGINVGGRCCRDYNVGYSEDKRVFVPETNYCGRAERRTDGIQ